LRYDNSTDQKDMAAFSNHISKRSEQIAYQIAYVKLVFTNVGLDMKYRL